MEILRIIAKILLIIYGLFLGTCLGIAIVENLRKDKDKKDGREIHKKIEEDTKRTKI